MNVSEVCLVMRRLIFFVLPGKTLSDILPRYKMSGTLSTRSTGIALLETLFLLDRNETVIGHSLGKLFNRNFWLFGTIGVSKYLNYRVR